MNNIQRCCYFILLLLGIANGFENADEEFIIGGENAGRVRYQVAIMNGRQVCSGAILNNRWIITSAVCAARRPQFVRVGSNRYNFGGQVYSIGNITRHPQSFVNIALIRTNATIAFSRTVNKIDLPNRDIRNNATLLVTGWGRTSVNSTRFARRLQQLNTTSISRRECNAKLQTFIRGEIFCTLSEKGGMCLGDSGNPVVRRNTLFGVTSAIRRPCNPGFPDRNVRVFNIKTWIETTISGN